MSKKLESFDRNNKISHLNMSTDIKVALGTRAIHTRRVARQYGVCWLKKEVSMVSTPLELVSKKETVKKKTEKSEILSI